MVGLIEENQEINKNVLIKTIKENIDINKNETYKTADVVQSNQESIVENEEHILEIIKILLDELINKVDNSNSVNESKESSVEGDGETIKNKGILKHEKTYSNKHVDFDLHLAYIPYDPKKDYTIDIQFVEKIPKKIVSYAALYAAKKKAEEQEEEEARRKAIINENCPEELKVENMEENRV